MAEVFSRSEALQRMHGNNYNCAQAVFTYYADSIDFSEEEAAAVAMPFGGGMNKGEVCGAASAALMVLGYKYGQTHDKDFVVEKANEFEEKFAQMNKSLRCKEILGYDFSLPGERERAQESGLKEVLCPACVASAINILDDLLKE